MVGTDHAGIATQMVVERQMNERQQKRTDFTRDEFIAKVWEWKAESGGTITSQLRRLGASCDWANERFTMDEGFSKAVTKVFVDLYNEGLIYRDKRLVNWDPGLKTAISDLEVETSEVNGKFWHCKYPLEDGSGYISVATTRPETMLADMRVAVNAKDERYTAFVGKNVRLPITGRLIPIITDDHADPELGSGAVKITPGHDFNDFEVGKRAGIKAGDMLNMLDAEAKVVQVADGLIPDALLGLTVNDARKAVVALIEAAGLVEKVEDRVIQTPYGDRSGVVIEPWLTDQWYVDAKTLAQPAIEAVRSGAIDVVPKSWEKTYFNWMENIQPWCVSRQLWWGHRIPAWYGPELESLADGTSYPKFGVGQGKFPLIQNPNVLVAQDIADLKGEFSRTYGSDASMKLCSNWDEYSQWFSEVLRTPNHPGRSGKEVPIVQDSDVLDTWFSSALWPFATLGWPDSNPPRNGEGDREAVVGQLQALSSDHVTAPPSALPPPPRPGEELVARHYPNDVLISGFDILFFWDARMIMQGLHFMKTVPWKTLYLHGLVRAADGSKMSKSKGNAVDPLGLIDQYGADALRFTLTAMESQGRDIKLDEKRVEGYRNFATKLWNAARFAQANGIGASTSLAAPTAELAVNRWIIGEVIETLGKLDQAIADLRFDAMADTIYHFAWGTYCDWYLELIKPGFVDGEKQPMDAESQTVAGWVLDQILVMLHPFMPFITEELWGAMGARDYELIHARWPEPMAELVRVPIVERLIALISEIRTIRTQNNLAWSDGLTLEHTGGSNDDWLSLLNVGGVMLSRMAKVIPIANESNDANVSPSDIAAYQTLGAQLNGFQFVCGGDGYMLGFPQNRDNTAERTRLTSAITSISKERDALSGRLNNPSFVERAKPEAVEKARADHAEKAGEVERLEAALARLG